MNERIKFGFKQSSCSCRDCVSNCKNLPGYLMPEDLTALCEASGLSMREFSEKHLLASPGAKVGNADGRVWRVPTIVPARQENGWCHWLNVEHRCDVYENSPYGCAFFGHESLSVGILKSKLAIQELNDLWNDPEPHLYKAVWVALWVGGFRAPAPEISRAKLWGEIFKEEVQRRMNP